jgi:tetratricopeptide (TPR) repeat protein
LGQVEQAIEHSQQAIAIFHEIGDRRREGVTLGNLGIAYYEVGQVEQAAETFQQGLPLARETGDRHTEGVLLGNLGTAYQGLGQADRAIETIQQAVAIAREVGNRYDEGTFLQTGSDALIAAGRYTDAIQNLRASLALFDEMGDPRGKSFSSGSLALVLLLSDDLTAARQAIQVARVFDVPEHNHSVAALHGVILARLGEREQARTAFEEALHYAEELLSKTPKFFTALYARGLALAGLALVAGANPPPTIDAYVSARAGCSAVGVVADQLRIFDALMACPGGEMLQPMRKALAG